MILDLGKHVGFAGVETGAHCSWIASLRMMMMMMEGLFCAGRRYGIVLTILRVCGARCLEDAWD